MRLFKKKFIGVLAVLQCIGLMAKADDADRLLDFAQHQKNKKKWDEARQSGSTQVKKAREQWQKKSENDVADYKAWKSRQKKAIDETSPEYFSDLKKRIKAQDDLEKLRLEFVKNRKMKDERKKSQVKLSEATEYGLDKQEDLVEFRKRPLYFKDQKVGVNNSGGSSGAPSFGGGSSFDRGQNFSPPPSAPPPPEFFDSDYSNQLPPPIPSEFDEGMPPPVFDDVAPPPF